MCEIGWILVVGAGMVLLLNTVPFYFFIGGTILLCLWALNGIRNCG